MKFTCRILLAAGSLLWPSTSMLQAAEPLGYTVPPLSPEPTGERHPGKFIWGDLFAEYPLQAGKFYSQVFGWNLRRLGTDSSAYWILSNGERPVAGVARRENKDQKPGSLQARWIGYISVENLEEAAQQVIQEGGKLLLEPRAVPDRGRLAIATDSEGTPVGLIYSDAGDPPDRMAEIGDWVWVQLFSRDPVKAVFFYQNVFGLEGVPDPRTGREDDFLLVSEGQSRAGLVPLEGASRRGGWMGFVRVADIDKSVRTARKIGGQVLMEPAAADQDGRIAVIADPYGGVVGLLQFSE